MSGHGFHVHGPHDHELEHAAAHGDKDRFAGTIAVATAILATVGALFSYMGGATQANAGLYKNNAAIKKTEASNQWNFYQAKSSKQNLAELALVLAPEDKRPGYRDEVERYRKEKAEIKLVADKLEAESADWDRRSDAELHQHHREHHAQQRQAESQRVGWSVASGGRHGSALIWGESWSAVWDLLRAPGCDRLS